MTESGFTEYPRVRYRKHVVTHTERAGGFVKYERTVKRQCELCARGYAHLCPDYKAEIDRQRSIEHV